MPPQCLWAAPSSPPWQSWALQQGRQSDGVWWRKHSLSRHEAGLEIALQWPVPPLPVRPPDRYTVGCFLLSTEGMTSLISWPLVTSMPLLTLMMGRLGGSRSCGGQERTGGRGVAAGMSGRQHVIVALQPAQQALDRAKPAFPCLDALEESTGVLHGHRMDRKLRPSNRLCCRSGGVDVGGQLVVLQQQYENAAAVVEQRMRQQYETASQVR